MPRPLGTALALLVTLFLVPPRAHALGTEALIYVAPSALSVSYDNLEYQLRSAGAASVLVVYSWPEGTDLAETYRLVVVTPIDAPLEAGTAADLSAFVDAGGGVVILAEHDFGEASGNELASALGLAARFELRDTGGGCASTDVSAASHPLTEAAPTMEFAWAREVSGGTLLYGTLAPIATLERTVVLVGDSDVFSDPVAFGGCGVGPSTERFYRNLFTSLADDSVGMMGADAGVMTAPDGGIVAGAVGAACASNADCASGMCASDGASSFCTVPCTDSCPSDLVCTAAGTGSLCVPRRSGGCSASPARTSSALGVASLLALAVLARRRAGRASST